MKRQDTGARDFLRLCDKIQKETGYWISFAHHYRYLVLLPQEADPEIEAARRFYGKLTDGRVYYRGIELRRHDYPVLLKEFQQKLLSIILEAERASDIHHLQFTKAVEYVRETLEKVLSGSLSVDELAISKILRMPIERYRVLSPHVLAAVQLRQNQHPVKPGDLIDYVYVDTKHPNPMKRIAPADAANDYEADKYAAMLMDVTESILGVFGFSRTSLGFQHSSKSFLEELRGETAKEILVELKSLNDEVKPTS